MCRRAECSHCGKPTYAGCGAHVEQVLGNISPADRCRCHEPKQEEQDPTAPDASGLEKGR